MQQDRDGDVVGQVGDQGGRRRPGELGDLEGVAEHDLAALGDGGRVLGEGPRQARGQQLVELDGHDPVDDLEQGQGQRPQAGADLDHDVVRPDAGLAHDAAHGVGVDDEVLPALLGGAQVELGGELTHLRRPEQPRTGGGV